MSTTITHATSAQHTGGIRLTRRGRLLVLLVSLAVIAVVAVLLSATSSASGDATGYPTRTVVVAPGDTLWDIADAAAGDDSTRDMVGTLQSLNALDGAGLQAGQRILVPLR
ncbi:MAG: LysM peptidoglycan-binding domain-containing protein [Nocardioides sp.]|nr:LysM peptidoglycan-binding domain-containing protein [Nocardioides sp.]